MEFDDRRPLSRMSTVIRNYREQLKDRPDITKNDRRWFAKRELLKGAAIRELRKPVDIRTVTKMDDEAVIHLIDGIKLGIEYFEMRADPRPPYFNDSDSVEAYIKRAKDMVAQHTGRKLRETHWISRIDKQALLHTMKYTLNSFTVTTKGIILRFKQPMPYVTDRGTFQNGPIELFFGRADCLCHNHIHAKEIDGRKMAHPHMTGESCSIRHCFGDAEPRYVLSNNGPAAMLLGIYGFFSSFNYWEKIYPWETYLLNKNRVSDYSEPNELECEKWGYADYEKSYKSYLLWVATKKENDLPKRFKKGSKPAPHEESYENF